MNRYPPGGEVLHLPHGGLLRGLQRGLLLSSCSGRGLISLLLFLLLLLLGVILLPLLLGWHGGGASGGVVLASVGVRCVWSRSAAYLH